MSGDLPRAGQILLAHAEPWERWRTQQLILRTASAQRWTRRELVEVLSMLGLRWRVPKPKPEEVPA